MNTSKKLLSINNLKKYFPIAKSSIFQKEQLYVKANEDISLDIYEGETIGVAEHRRSAEYCFNFILKPRANLSITAEASQKSHLHTSERQLSISTAI